MTSPLEIIPDPWGGEKQRCMRWAGRRFIAHLYGYTYEWEAENAIYPRVDDRKPYLLARPVRRISGKQGWLRARQIFHAENLPTVV